MPSIRVTNQLPIKTPTKINAAQLLSNSRSTLPLLWCERIELIDVGIIVASDVAVAITIEDSADTPKLWNKKKSTGTITMPPAYTE